MYHKCSVSYINLILFIKCASVRIEILPGNHPGPWPWPPPLDKKYVPFLFSKIRQKDEQTAHTECARLQPYKCAIHLIFSNVPIPLLCAKFRL